MNPKRLSFRILPSRRGARAFTLIEIMMVVAIIGLAMAVGAPAFYRAVNKEGFRKTVSDVLDVCTAARAQAILKGSITEVEFHPTDRWCDVVGGSKHRATFGDNTTIEMLDVNLRECKDTEAVRVRFFPNGTSDEMTLILRSDKDEWRKIALEITTGLASVESDPSKWR